jgi:membrane associated rhomboid family serine protease
MKGPVGKLTGPFSLAFPDAADRMCVTMITRLIVIAAICTAMIAVHVIDLFLGGFLKSFGINPRELDSIYTIFTAPWLHGDFGHLGSNLALFVIFASLCLLNGIRYFTKASILIIAFGGAMLWLFGREANHIGASGWIFGLWSLTIALAWFDRSFRNIAISLGVVFFYGSLAFGVLPMQSHVSFEGHFFGALAGVIAAFALSKQPRLAPSPAPAGELKFWS